MGPDDQYGQENQPQPADASQNEDVLDPVKKISVLDKTLDKAFEQILTDINSNNETLINTTNNINLRDLASLYKNTKSENSNKSAEDIIKEKTQGLDESILSQLQNLSVPKERLERYKQYSQLPYELYIATRIVQVYMDNILIKNPYTKQFIDIMESEILEKDSSITDTDKQSLLKITKAIFAYFDIQKRLKNDILSKQLVLGNFFVEIANLNKFIELENDTDSMRIITESYGGLDDAVVSYKSHKHNIGIEFDLTELYHEQINEDLNTTVATTETNFDRQIDMLMESRFKDVGYESQILFEQIEDNDTVEQVVENVRSLDLSKIKYVDLRYISPENVIILEKNGNKYGYIVIEGKDNINKSGVSGAENYNLIKQVTDKFSATGISSTSSKKSSEGDAVDQVLMNIFKKLRVKKNVSKISELLNLIQDDNTIHALKSVLYDLYLKHSNVSIRYIPNENMVNFSNPIEKYSPYGTSVFDTVLFPAKLYTIGLLSSVMSRLNRASVVRKWTIEAGSHKNHAELVEKFKRELRNQTISFQDLMKMKDVTQTVSDYKDFVTISQDGKRYVDLEMMPMHDRSLPVNELEPLKQDLIAASGIPSPMLGITDTYDLREQIVNVNIIFAQKIDSFQTYINESLEELVNGVLRQLFILNGRKDDFNSISKYIDIKLNPPLVLVLQHLESTLSSSTNIVNLLNQVNIPTDPIWILKRFIKTIDWDAVKQAGVKFQQDQQTQQALQQEIQQALQPQQQQGGGF